MAHQHTVKTYEEDLRALNAQVHEMGRLASEQLERAMRCVVRPEPDMCSQIVRDDAKLDRLEREIDTAVIRLLALRQPMAVDLREIIVALRLSSELERIGDLSSNIAKRAGVIDQLAAVPPIGSVPELGRQVGQRLERVLVALSRRDTEEAARVWREDSEIDERYTAIFRETLTYMMEDPRTISGGSHLLFVAKNLERIGDHCTNIAELVRFLVTGEEAAEERPKGDDSLEVSTLPVEPGGR
jgi:phosphate transport system protein